MKLKTNNPTNNLKMTRHGQHNSIDLNKKQMIENKTQQTN
jgi:hypothetical protein